MDAGRKRHQMFAKRVCGVLMLTVLLSLIPSVSSAETTSAFQEGMEYVKLATLPTGCRYF